MKLLQTVRKIGVKLYACKFYLRYNFAILFIPIKFGANDTKPLER